LMVGASHRPLIGLCASVGGLMPANNRALSPVQVSRLVASFPGAIWINLSQTPIELPNVHNSLGTIQQLAEVIAALDCVISVDTFACHLAASLGRRTLILLKQRPAWFYHYPFYTNATLIRDRMRSPLQKKKPALDDAIDQAIGLLKIVHR
jgi:hypothetical protein